jgi:hypothetical protein
MCHLSAWASAKLRLGVRRRRIGTRSVWTLDLECFVHLNLFTSITHNRRRTGVAVKNNQLSLVLVYRCFMETSCIIQHRTATPPLRYLLPTLCQASRRCKRCREVSILDTTPALLKSASSQDSWRVNLRISVQHDFGRPSVYSRRYCGSNCGCQSPATGWYLRRTKSAKYNANNPIILFIIQAAIVIALCRALYWPLGKIRQPPVIAEVITVSTMSDT